jgi:hypothetical protein
MVEMVQVSLRRTHRRRLTVVLDDFVREKPQGGTIAHAVASQLRMVEGEQQVRALGPSRPRSEPVSAATAMA